MGPDVEKYFEPKTSTELAGRAMTDLLPCPFCGQSVSVGFMDIDDAIPFSRSYWYIDHGTDGTDNEGSCKVSFTVMPDKKRLIDSWNTRAR